MNLPIEDYFAHAYRLTDREVNIRDALMEWLPDHIIDAHAHGGLQSHVIDISQKTMSHMLSTFPYFSLEDSEKLRQILFPGKSLQSLRFAKTFRGLDHRTANDYLLEHSPKTDRIALFGLPEDIEYTNRMLRHPRVSALKMYWSYVEPTAETIYEFFCPEILEEAQGLDVPIVLHLPKMIVQCLDDLLKVIADFPKIRMTLAHLGLSAFPVPGLREAFEAIKPFETVFMDNSLNQSVDVTDEAISVLGSTRILYGSDEPLNLIRYVAYDHPEKGQRIVSDYPYHWVDAQEFRNYGHLAKNSIHSHWGNLLALKYCIEKLPKKQQQLAKENIFQKNASFVYGF